MKQPDFKLIFLRSKALQAQLSLDHSGECLHQLCSFFEDAREATQRLIDLGGDQESQDILVGLSNAFERCQTVLRAVWADLHQSLTEAAPSEALTC